MADSRSPVLRDKIKGLIGKYGRKQSQVARAARMSDAALSDFIHDRGGIDLSECVEIAKFFKVDLNWLADDEDLGPPRTLEDMEGARFSKEEKALIERIRWLYKEDYPELERANEAIKSFAVRAERFSIGQPPSNAGGNNPAPAPDRERRRRRGGMA